MATYLRLLLQVLDRSTRRSLAIALTLSVLLATAEAIAVVLVVPLFQALTAAAARDELPLSTQWVADLLDADSPATLATHLGVIIAGVFICRSIASVFYLRWYLRITLDAEAKLSTRLLNAYLHAPLRFHLERNTASLQRTVNESARRVANDGLNGIVGASSDGIVIFGVTVVLLIAEPLTAFASVVYFGIVAVGYQKLIHSRASLAAASVHDEVAVGYLIVQQSLGSARDIQLRAKASHFVALLADSRRRAAKGNRTVLLTAQAPRFYLELALVIGVAMMSIVLFSTRSLTSAITVIGLFLAAGFRMLPSLNRVLGGLATARSTRPFLEEIVSDFQLLAENPDNHSTEHIPTDATVHLSKVSFSYDHKVRVLENIDLIIPPGKQVALVGPSGSGKSTIADLVVGLLDPDSGAILVGQRPLHEVRSSWQSNVSMVPQTVTLLDGSLRSNIAFGRSADDIDDFAVREALSAAMLDDLLSSLPGGLDAALGENGVRLSGGQRQRVGIARALFDRPRLLVLDEATAALDNETEQAITKTLGLVRGSMGLLIIAHRLSTIRESEIIYVIHRGRVEAAGTFESLLEESPLFAHLVSLGDLSAGIQGTAYRGL